MQNARGERGGYDFSPGLDCADDFSATDYFRGGESGNLLREYQIDFQLDRGLQYFISFKKHSRPADVFGGACVPFLLAETAITERQLDMESLRAHGRSLLGACGVKCCSGLHRHIDLRGSWSCIEHFADFSFQVAKGEGLLKQAYAGVQHAVVSDHVLGITGHVENFHVGTNFTNTLGQLAAVHARHDHVGKQQVDHLVVGDGDLHGDRAVGGFDHLVSLFFQILAGEVAQVGFVLDEQDSFGAGLDFAVFDRSGDMRGRAAAATRGK